MPASADKVRTADSVLTAAGIEILHTAHTVNVGQVGTTEPGAPLQINERYRIFIRKKKRLGSADMHRMVTLLLSDKMFSPYWALCGGDISHLIEVESEKGSLRVFLADSDCDEGMVLLRQGERPHEIIDTDLTAAGRKAIVQIARKALQRRGSR